MAELIKMPKLSDTMEEGGIASWLKKEGEMVKEGEALLEIETDKATMEYVSPVEGVLLKILVSPGNSVKLQEPIAIVGEKNEKFDLNALIGSAPKKEAHTTKNEEKTPEAPTENKEPQVVATLGALTKIKASPLAKKLAAQKNLDLKSLSGSGPLGRIIARDVENFKADTAYISTKRTDQKIPHTMMRKTIAKRLLAGKNNAPHFYLTVTVNMDPIWHWRQTLNQSDNLVKESVKVSFNDMIILATSRALKSHPLVNASWQEESIIQFGRIDIAMAVALESGLVTPVIRNVNELGILDIARQAKALGAKAKAGQLKPEEYAEGTFTISNLGMTCVEEFTAIINPPQACILAVGTIKPQPYVTKESTLGIQKQMKMTLSCDHRVVDGMVGARFLETLVRYLENPLMMLE